MVGNGIVLFYCPIIAALSGRTGEKGRGWEKGWGKGNTTETNRGREGLINKEAGLERTKRLENTGNQGSKLRPNSNVYFI